MRLQYEQGNCRCQTLQLPTAAIKPINDQKVEQQGPPGEYVGDFDYLLQHGADINTANYTRHRAH